MKSIIKGTEGVEFNGFFIPTSEWHYVLVMKATNYEKSLQVMKTYIEKFGWAKTSLAKAELLHTFGDLGLTIRQIAQLDGRDVEVFMEQEPGSSGVNDIDRYAGNVLLGNSFRGIRSTGRQGALC